VTTARLTEADLQAIEAREKAAKPGPWARHPNPRFYVQWNEKHGEATDEEHEANAQFCAAAREDVPRLLAEVRALRAELEEYRAWPCESHGCEHTLADVLAHDASHPNPSSGGAWFCSACWNRAQGGLLARAEKAEAERDRLAAKRKAERWLLEGEPVSGVLAWDRPRAAKRRGRR
jgi:hypothetical protein